MSSIPRKNVAHSMLKNIRFSNNKASLYISFVLILALVLYFSLTSSADSKKDRSDKKYYEVMLQERKNKDDFFKHDKDSPLLEETKKKFKGLKYFKPDSNFKFQSKLIPFSKKDTMNILTTKNDIRKMVRYGKLEFLYKGKSYNLTVYLPTKNPGSDHFFLPFTDKSNKKQTYSGGRYIDIVINKSSNDYELDFNLAYNPYCAYNPKYSCPIVPKENHLPVSIEAGEKLYKLK